MRAETWRKLVEITPGGRRIPVADSGHFIPFDQPQEVIDAIVEMMKLSE